MYNARIEGIETVSRVCFVCCPSICKKNGAGMEAEKKPKPRPNTQLRHQRELRNFTLQDVADQLYDMCVNEHRKSGISADTVGRWERGISQPEAHYRAKLCKLFGK